MLARTASADIMCVGPKSVREKFTGIIRYVMCYTIMEVSLLAQIIGVQTLQKSILFSSHVSDFSLPKVVETC